ncbi:MAG TPA: SURF1 family protein [Ilumatobacter sp.]|nr:SURF1 family protein [Ilumatobacter sp.]
MYRFLLRPKWVGFHLLVVAAIVTMVNLGFWQLGRLDERQAFNAVVDERYDAPPLALDQLLTADTDPADVEWRPVTAAGTYLADHTILIVNRSQGGRAGQNVLVPMRLADGRILLVNRGFMPLGTETAPGVPASDIEIVARLRASQERRLGQLSDAADGELTIAQRVDIDRLAAQMPGDVVPMYVDLIESVPAEVGGAPEPVARPTLGEGNHMSYAVQWFIFAAAVAVGWVLAVRRSIATRRAASAA